MARLHEIQGWESRYLDVPQIAEKMREAERDPNIILLARGESTRSLSSDSFRDNAGTRGVSAGR
jgi:hypothetical protein